MNTSTTARSTRLLLAGALLGALLAATGLVERHSANLDEALVASVNGEGIALAQYQLYLETLARDRSSPLSEEDRQQVLERLIDERLLLQRAADTGLLRRDPALRKAIVDAMVENIIASNPESTPDEDGLAAFYQANLAYFSSAPLLWVERMVFRGDDAEARADTARGALERGEAFAEVEAALADREILALPAGPIPANRLVNYLGPGLVEELAALPEGAISGPHAVEGSLALLQLTARSPGQAPALAQISEQVAREYQRRAGETLLREYLDELRDSAAIRRRDPLPSAP